MSEELYLRLVQGVGREDGQRAFYALVQADDEPRITRRIDKLLDTYGQPRLDHLPPALYFERHQSELLADLDQGTLERAASVRTVDGRTFVPSFMEEVQP
jgi:hypothetical protein